MDNKPFHATVSNNPIKILDIGCGTGAMTRLLARKYPEAQIIGLDMSAVPEGRYTKLAHVEFVQADILDLLRDGKDEKFQPESFDYIFQRLLIFGMKSWPRYLSDVTRLLKPGGWLELHEGNVNIRKSENGPSLSDSWFHYPRWKADAEAIGLDIEIGAKLVGLFETTDGLDDISEYIYRIFPKSWPDRPELDGLGDRIGPMFAGVMRKTSKTQRSEEEVREMEKDLQAIWTAGFEHEDAYQMHVVTARKT